MNSIELFFSESYELYKIKLVNERLLSPVISTRGKTSTFSNGTFQWTQAVKGLSLLVINYALGNKGITGGENSLASSLDYAITKQPLWLKELFGNLLKKTFKRINSERKNKFDVKIYFSSIFENSNFRIFINDKVATYQDLIFLQNTINAADQDIDQKVKKVISDSLENELNSMLRITNIFTQQNVKNLLKKMHNNSFNNILGNNQFKYSEIDLELSSSQKLGLSFDLNSLKDTPFSVAASGTLVGGLGIFKYLNSIGYNFNINGNFPHAVEIVRQMTKDNFLDLPDLIILGSAPAAQLYTSKYANEYETLMFLPKVSHGIISSKNSDHSKYAIISDDPSLPKVIFDEMYMSGCLKPKKQINLEPDQTFNAFRQQDNLDSILFFPHYKVNLAFNNCESFHSSNELLNQDVVLLVNKRISNNHKRQINSLIRNAWLELILDKKEMKKMVTLFQEDTKYINLVKKITGICSSYYIQN